jgi:two-component system, sensor histidine kinase LadS
MLLFLLRFIVVISLLHFNHAFAFALSPELSAQDPTSEVEYLEDKTGQLTLKDIIAADSAQSFKPVNALNKVIYFGQSSSTFWLKLPLKTTEVSNEDWVLDIQSTHLDEVTFYGFNTLPIKTGSMLSFATRPYAYRNFAFPLTLQTQEHNFF